MTIDKSGCQILLLLLLVSRGPLHGMGKGREGNGDGRARGSWENSALVVEEIDASALISVNRFWQQASSEHTSSFMNDRPHLSHYLPLSSRFLHWYQITLLGNRHVY